MPLPRAACPVCGRTVALMPTKRLGHGVVVDHKRERKSLMLCAGSETRLPLAHATAWQLELHPGDPTTTDPEETMPLF